MGVGASTAAGLENPFPIEPGMEKDLLRLSYVVSRLLNKPDLYDLNNLARPGACGDYAVFLKEKLERRLMPFVADICGETLAVVYQNPLKSFESVERRKQVCQDLANTMIRLVSIVIACLASIQFESPRAREAAGIPATGPVTQRGGAIDIDLIRWLQQNKYIAPTYVPSSIASRIEIPLRDPGLTESALPSDPRFTLQINREAEPDGIYKGYITVTGGVPALPATGFLKVYFMKPIVIVPTTGASILPIQVVDSTGVTWMCGVLYTYMFISLAQGGRPAHLFDVLTSIFRKTQPDIPLTEDFVESRSALQQAENIFNTARSQRSPQAILQTLAPIFSSIEGYRPQISSVGYPSPYTPGSAGVGGIPQGFLLPRRPIQTAAAYGAAAVRPGELVAADYVIPPPAAKAILTTFRRHAGEIGAANNPAQIRATLLAGEVLRDRTIQTRICQDPYWNATNLSSVYPWAALQFLCIENFRTLGDSASAQAATAVASVIPAPVTAISGVPPAPVRPTSTGIVRPKLTSEWIVFLNGLRELYRGEEVGLPSLSLPVTTTSVGPQPQSQAQALEDLRFLNVAKTKGCTTPGRSPRARFQEIQNGVLRLQGLYEEHAKEVWKILNSLVYLIEDPDSKAELVRLNPKIFSSGGGTRTYIEEKAKEARNLLIKYYLEVEKTYTETIQRMRILS